MVKDVSKYEVERAELLKRILEILEITDKNKMLSLKELDENKEKQDLILSLEADVKKYFYYSRWCYFIHKNKNLKRDYLSLLKSLLKNLNVKVTTSTLLKRINENKTECETYYILNV